SWLVVVFLTVLPPVRAPACTAVSTLPLHDALPISTSTRAAAVRCAAGSSSGSIPPGHGKRPGSGSKTPASTNLSAPVVRSTIARSEEHTSELQSRENLVCRLLLDKKNAQHHPGIRT